MKQYFKAYILVLVVLLQSLVVILITNQIFLNLLEEIIVAHKYLYFIMMFIELLGGTGIISIFYIIKFVKKEKESILKLNNSREVIDALQGQKHDFNNHLNVIGGMIQLGKDQKALDYIFDVSGRVEEVFSISKIENVEIAATLFRKCAIAENKGINVDLDIDTNLEHLKIDPIDFCKIIFNLVDNAIYELERCKEDDKDLAIDIHELDDKYSIAIGNSFPVLSQDLYEKVFESGYSTKKQGSGHGYGLSIVKNIVQKNKGQVIVESYENVGTVFTVYLPMKSCIKKADII